jgi:hypothetical protein
VRQRNGNACGSRTVHDNRQAADVSGLTASVQPDLVDHDDSVPPVSRLRAFWTE